MHPTPASSPRSPDKASLRRQWLRERQRLSAAERAAQSDRISTALLAWPALRSATRIALYASIADEPSTDAMRCALRDRGTTLLLPCLRDDLDLDWVVDSGAALVPGLHGTRQPPGHALGVEAIRWADVVLVPALAVALDGTRLGRGGGSYDRALARVAPSTPTVAVVFAEEVVERLPSEQHDVVVRAAATPTGLRWLGPAQR